MSETVLSPRIALPKNYVDSTGYIWYNKNRKAKHDPTMRKIPRVAEFYHPRGVGFGISA